MPLEYNILTTYLEFEALRKEWNPLLRQTPVNSVFLTWEWLNAWWLAYRKKEEPFIIVFYDRGELVGIAPFVKNVIAGPFSREY